MQRIFLWMLLIRTMLNCHLRVVPLTLEYLKCMITRWNIWIELILTACKIWSILLCYHCLYIYLYIYTYIKCLLITYQIFGTGQQYQWCVYCFSAVRCNPDTSVSFSDRKYLHTHSPPTGGIYEAYFVCWRYDYHCAIKITTKKQKSPDLANVIWVSKFNVISVLHIFLRCWNIAISNIIL